MILLWRRSSTHFNPAFGYHRCSASSAINITASGLSTNSVPFFPSGTYVLPSLMPDALQKPLPGVVFFNVCRRERTALDARASIVVLHYQQPRIRTGAEQTACYWKLKCLHLPAVKQLQPSTGGLSPSAGVRHRAAMNNIRHHRQTDHLGSLVCYLGWFLSLISFTTCRTFFGMHGPNVRTPLLSKGPMGE